MNLNHGVFTISLDVELNWGVRNGHVAASYAKNLAGAGRAVTEMLTLFREHGIHATWAVVGFLFFRDHDELKRHVPSVLPAYADSSLSPYRYMDQCAALDRGLHFAPELIDSIRETDGQEIGTHTFSHYYCCEEGQDAAAFRADLEAAVQTAERRGIETRSLVFPRNQYRAAYLPVLRELGLSAYRGPEDAGLYRAMSGRKHNRAPRRALRLMDSYLNLTGHHVHALADLHNGGVHNIAASRFLRPCSGHSPGLEHLRLKRITAAMTDAARRGGLYHLWWHPHNWGADLEGNAAFLRKILQHFADLRRRYDMQPLNMGEVSALLESRPA